MANLPNAYTELEYLQSTGTQVVELNYNCTPNTSFDIRFEIADMTPGTTYCLFGAAPSLFLKYGDGINATLGNGTNEIDLGVQLIANQTYELHFEQGNVLLDGVKVSDTSTSFVQYAQSIALFGFISNTILSYGSKVKIYTFSLYEDGALTYELYPVKRTDGTCGFYNPVGYSFFTAGGTGTLMPGPEVSGLRGQAPVFFKTSNTKTSLTLTDTNTIPKVQGTVYFTKDGKILYDIDNDTRIVMADHVANSDESDTVDGYHAHDFVFKRGDTMTGTLQVPKLEVNGTQIAMLTSGTNYFIAPAASEFSFNLVNTDTNSSRFKITNTGILPGNLTEALDIGDSTHYWKDAYILETHGNATSASYPEGFDQRTTESWIGNESITTWKSNDGGKIGFVNVDGKLNIYTNGFLYQNTNNLVLDAENYTEYAVAAITSTDNAITRFNGTRGQVQNSGVILDDQNNITNVNRLTVEDNIISKSDHSISRSVFSNPGLTVGSPQYDHVEYDSTAIQAKAATTQAPSDLRINPYGGEVKIGSGGLSVQGTTKLDGISRLNNKVFLRNDYSYGETAPDFGEEGEMFFEIYTPIEDGLPPLGETGQLLYKVTEAEYDAGWLSSTIGSGDPEATNPQPIWIKRGVPLAMTSTVGSSGMPIFMEAGVLKQLTFVPNVLYYYDSANNILTPGTHYIDSTKVAIGTNLVQDYSFYVNGTTGIASNLDLLNGIINTTTGTSISIQRNNEEVAQFTKEGNFTVGATADGDPTRKLYVKGSIGTNGDGIYFQGTQTENKLIGFLDNTTSTGGNGITVGGGGIVIIGSGESVERYTSTTATDAGEESLFLLSDNSITLYSNCDTIGSKVGVVFDNSGNFRPDVNNSRSLGSTNYHWKNLFGYNAEFGGSTSAVVAAGSAVNPSITFKNADGSEYASLVYTDYDSYQAPDSLTLIGNQDGTYFIAPNIKAKTAFYGNLTGNADTATKWKTARTIRLLNAVDATAQTIDGTGDIEIPINGLKEAYLQWGGKHFSADFSPLDASLVPELGANRLAFMPAAAITIEYSRDGGETWQDYGASNEAKINLFSGTGTNIMLGKADSTNKATADYKTRIIINTSAASVYTVLNKFVLYISTNGSTGCTCKIDARLQKYVNANEDRWFLLANDAPIAGWSGYNVLNVGAFTTYGNTPESQYGQIRFTFSATGGSASYVGLNIMKIFGFGGVGWTTPSTLAKTGNLFTWDANQNATFPAQITANQFNGLATKAQADENGLNIATGYLKLSGGTMNGILTLQASQNSGNYALNANASSMINVNGLNFVSSTSFKNGVNFKSGRAYDSMTASSGSFYFGAGVTDEALTAAEADANIYAGTFYANGKQVATQEFVTQSVSGKDSITSFLTNGNIEEVSYSGPHIPSNIINKQVVEFKTDGSIVESTYEYDRTTATYSATPSIIKTTVFLADGRIEVTYS